TEVKEYDPAKIFTGEVLRVGSYAAQKPPYHQKNPFMARVICNRELNLSGSRSVRHIEFDLTGSRLRYEAGDHLAIHPENDTDLVNEFGELLNTNLDDVISLDCTDEYSNRKHPFPVPCSYRTALTYYADIASLPKTNVLFAIAEYCSNHEEKEFLLKLSSVDEEGRKLYSSWVWTDHRTILDILHDLPSCRPPLDLLLELLPRLQPRYYSISSSPKVDANVVSITAAVLQYTTPLGRVCKGVATNYLASKIPCQDTVPKVPIFVRRSQIRLPYTPSVPVLMIGPGTGFAPFRGFIQERIALSDLGKIVGANVLYFGCQRRTDGYLYKDELETWNENGNLTEFHVAFSREQQHKIYVQHLLMKNKSSVWSTVRSGAHVYVCGDAKHMARDVQNTLVKIFIEEGNLSVNEADEYLKSMEKKKLYQADIWS
ncbi:unnamed protein product, partial [Soboliphyme baturini]|uniref:NADPH--hemoprotein reductase n=1 Tax=Soboliphyme baturini TaxID=241478 RepID=A0A183J7A0_9BILA